MSISEIIRQTLAIEAEALNSLVNADLTSLADVVELVSGCPGRVVLTGVGKSALAAKKIAATLNSTGSSSIYMHAGDAVHGDLGVIQRGDVVIVLSKSGNSDELKQLIPQVKQRGASLVGFVSNEKSYLASHADIVVHIPVSQEADPHGLAPTTSIIAHIAVGDAMAMALQHTNGWNRRSFAAVHPAGTLGKRLSMRVSDFQPELKRPTVTVDTSIRKTIVEISAARMGATAVVRDDKVVGIITDGDLRRMLEGHENINLLKAADIMSTAPRSVHATELAYEALKIMEHYNISQLLVIDNDVYIGVIHIHDLISSGL